MEKKKRKRCICITWGRASSPYDSGYPSSVRLPNEDCPVHGEEDKKKGEEELEEEMKELEIDREKSID